MLKASRHTAALGFGARGLPRYEAYRDSGVEWLGEVPGHWEVKRLKWSRAAAVNGVWGDEPDGENDIPCIRVTDFDRRRFRVNFFEPTLRAITPSQRAGRELRTGDLLLEKSDGGDKQMVGCLVLYDHDEPAVNSNFIARISTAEGASPGFWTYVHAAFYAGKAKYFFQVGASQLAQIDLSPIVVPVVKLVPGPSGLPRGRGGEV